ncbi:MAG TPA: hypothetical protein VNS79_14165 [Sphingobium sp.]|nr:hypothetical protein [Sphingobium sp.]
MHGPLLSPLPSLTRHSPREFGWALALLALLAFGVRAYTFGNPVIGYDEQFYLLVGDRMLHGAIPYVDIFDRKPVGLFLVYAGVRLLGGDGFLVYKLVAACVVALTAGGVFCLARRRAGFLGALCAAILFILWHNFMGGEGGQAPVFYDLFMAAAALCMVVAIDRPARLRALGVAAMLATGIALQIKYSVLFEGVYFGCALIWLAVRGGQRAGVLAGSITLWIGAALLPTLAALGVYAAMGQADAFIFANFLSVLAQGRNPMMTQLRDLAEIGAILSPLLILLAVSLRRRQDGETDAAGWFIIGWLVASVVGVLAFWRFNSPHYALPVLVPLTIWLAPLFDRMPRRAVGLVGLATVMSQLVLIANERRVGGAPEAARLAQAAQAGSGCIYVYAGYPALYMLTGSCLPSRWAFPGTLNMRDEQRPDAIGTDPAGEVHRILAGGVPVIVDEYPRNTDGNPATRAVLDHALAADYVLAACPATGEGRAQLVYRRKRPGEAARPASCAMVAPAPTVLVGHDPESGGVRKAPVTGDLARVAQRLAAGL